MASPIPDYKMTKKVQELRSKGKTFREIQEITGKDLKSLNRWSKYKIPVIPKRA